MPYLKFTRDRRGYEHTYLLHSAKRRGRGRPILLYWYRTPPHVKVGRAAFDPEAIRLLEDLHPDLEFDWPHILEARPRPAEPESRPVQKRTRPAPASSPPLSRPAAAAVHERSQQDEPATWAETDEGAAAAEAAEGAMEPASDPAVPDTGIETPDSEEEEAAGQFLDDNGRPHHASEPSAAEQVLGAEALARLRARYAQILSRIERRVVDPARQQALRGQAEAINPDNWVTRAEVQAALETLEQKTADLYRMTGRRRRRRRGRREGGGGEQAATSEGQQASTEPEEVALAGEDEDEQVEN